MEPVEHPDHLQAHIEHNNYEDEPQSLGWKKVCNPCPHLGHRDTGNSQGQPGPDVDIAEIR